MCDTGPDQLLDDVSGVDVHRQQGAEGVAGPGRQTGPHQLHHHAQLGLQLLQELGQRPSTVLD